MQPKQFFVAPTNEQADTPVLGPFLTSDHLFHLYYFCPCLRSTKDRCYQIDSYLDHSCPYLMIIKDNCCQTAIYLDHLYPCLTSTEDRCCQTGSCVVNASCNELTAGWVSCGTVFSCCFPFSLPSHYQFRRWLNDQNCLRQLLCCCYEANIHGHPQVSQ